MTDQLEFPRAVEVALDSLKRHLIAREEESPAGFEVDEQGGVLNVIFDDSGSRFVITSNATVRQIWISALSTSFKLIWDSKTEAFILPPTGETLTNLIDRLIGEYHAPSPSHI